MVHASVRLLSKAPESELVEATMRPMRPDWGTASPRIARGEIRREQCKGCEPTHHSDFVRELPIFARPESSNRCIWHLATPTGCSCPASSGLASISGSEPTQMIERIIEATPAFRF